MTEVNLKLKGMSCALCANNIERALLNVSGVIDGSVNFSSDRQHEARSLKICLLREIEADI